MPALRAVPPAPAAAPERRAHAIWSWLVAFAIVPVFWVSRGTALGEPFADDFDFLHHTLFTGRWQLLDGGGGGLYWRPLARQAYYGLLGPLLLSHPLAVAVLHAAAFALAAVLLQRALSRVWPAPAAALAAVFPLALPGVRVMLAWPSCAQDLGVIVGLAGALYALSRGRPAWALAALAGALLCKEIAAPLSLLLPFAPFPAMGARAPRMRFALQLGALLVVYAGAHEAVRVLAHQLPLAAVTPHDAQAAPLSAQVLWALQRTAADAFDSPETGDLHRTLIWGVVACFAAAIAVVFVSHERRRLMGSLLPWVLWGLAFWVAGSAPLAPYFPAWATYRSVAPAIGLGIAAAALLAAAWPSVLVTFAGVHLAGVLFAPGAPPLMDAQWSDHGAAFDFPRLTQVQRFVHGVRIALAGRTPPLPRGAVVVRHAWPRATDYAFAHDQALHVWYRDTTMHMIAFEALQADTSLRADAIVEFQPHREPQLTLVEPAAMRALIAAVADLRRGAYGRGIAALQALPAVDTASAVFRATVQSKLAAAYIARGGAADGDSAAAAAARAFAIYPDDKDARVFLALAAERRGEPARARALLETHLQRYPDDAQARAALQRLPR